jgi:hypothetical protein
MDRNREKKRKSLLRELAGLKVIIRGSYLERMSTCVRQSCECHRGKKHGPRGYVTSGKPQRQHYVPAGQRDAAKRGVKEYQRLLEVADELTKIHLELLSEGKLDGSES